MIYKKNRFATIEWDEADKIAFITWHTYADGADYREVLTALNDLMEEKGASKLLADTRKSKAVTPEDQEWVNSTWTPRMTKAGLRFSALLVPESTVAKLSLDRMRSKYTTPQGGGAAYFTDLNEARAWLRAAGR